MFIKEITICGFKSYKDKTVLTELEDGLNVIVGRNGSGKSNIFAAIEFALTVEYRNLKSEARTALISHNKPPHEVSYVEIVFDNTDRKLPVADNTVTFRRDLNLKKDRFYVNGKVIANAKQFLDIAGFSNPYFIVKQGKVLDLALATDQQRLKILSCITGSSDYDDKIADCRKSIEECSGKKKNIDKMLADLNERKNTLEAEVLDQKRYIKLDQGKRAVENILHERKLKVIQEKLEELNTKRAESAKRHNPVRMEVEKIARELQVYRRDVSEIEENIQHLDDVNKELESQRNELTANLATHNQELEDRKNRQQNTGSSISQVEKEISETMEMVKKAEEELVRLQQPMKEILNQKCQLDERAKVIQEKEFVKNSMSTTDYRKHIKNKLKEITKTLNDRKAALHTTMESEQSANQILASEERNLENMKAELSNILAEILAVNKELANQKTIDVESKNRLDVTYGLMSEIIQKLNHFQERTMRIQEECKKCFGVSAFYGWTGVQQIIDDFKKAGTHPEIVEGYHGIVCELFQCDNKLDLAVEAAGGKRLVNHVVDSKDVANAILREFNKRKLRGEVNFMPLNSIKDVKIVVQDGLRGATPIISQLQFDRKFERVMKFNFGNILLCDSLETATGMMRQHKLKCVTLDGEKVSSRGELSGGYNQNRAKKLELTRARASDEKELAYYKNRKVQLDQQTKQCIDEYKLSCAKSQQLETQKDSLGSKKRELLAQIQTLEKKICVLKDQLKGIERMVKDTQLDVKALEERLVVLESNPESSSEKMKLLENIQNITAEYSKLEKEYAQKQSEKSALQIKLQQLQDRYYDEIGLLSQNDNESFESEIKRFVELIRSLNNQLVGINTKIQKNVEEIVALQKTASTKLNMLDQLQEKEAGQKDILRELCTDLESFTSKHSAIQEQLLEHKREAANLGSVPLNMAEYENFTTQELYSKLKKFNMKLKKFVQVGVNQKAIQQFEEVEKSCTVFDQRMRKIVDEEKDLLEVLVDSECKKGEAMLHTFRELQTQFQLLFSKIVPNGHAELVLFGNGASVDREVSIDSDQLREMAGQNRFEGVKVVVNFVGKTITNASNLAPLSGGQKSIIALCLILAIQTIDPVPFYLFDEVDQALDEAYRDAVANEIRIMSERSQFICTTFRKEFVNVADKVFGVTYQNRNSHIAYVTDTQAMDFVEMEVEDSHPQATSEDSPDAN